MKKIKVTILQEKKLVDALQKEAQARTQFNMAKLVYENAMRSRKDIVDMIADLHGVDLSKMDDTMTLKDGFVILEERAAKSEVIKKTLKGKK
jgi:hypothetical protein